MDIKKSIILLLLSLHISLCAQVVKVYTFSSQQTTNVQYFKPV